MYVLYWDFRQERVKVIFGQQKIHFSFPFMLEMGLCSMYLHIFHVYFRLWSWCWNAEAKRKLYHYQHNNAVNVAVAALSNTFTCTRAHRNIHTLIHSEGASRIESISIDSRIICFTLNVLSLFIFTHTQAVLCCLCECDILINDVLCASNV